MAERAHEHEWWDFHLHPEDREAISDFFEVALTGLSFVFLGLLLVEYAFSLNPEWSRRLELANLVIWAAFAIEFFTRLALAGDRWEYLRSNLIPAVAVVLPAFRVFRAARAVRVLRSLRVARLVTAGNRGRVVVAKLAGRNAFGYVVALTVVVVVLAGVGVYSLESEQAASGIDSPGDGLWWAATTVTTLGSAHYPVTVEGRVLGVIVMIYGLAISGYVTAVLAVFLLGKRAAPEEPAQSELAAEIAALRAELREVRREQGFESPALRGSELQDGELRRAP